VPGNLGRISGWFLELQSASDAQAVAAFKTRTWSEIHGVGEGFSKAVKPGDDLFAVMERIYRAQCIAREMRVAGPNGEYVSHCMNRSHAGGYYISG
jgi:hypothetical protein